MPTPSQLRLAFGAFVCALVASPAYAIVATDIEPIIGYERVQKLIPTPHTTDRLVYGGRIVTGLPLISIETEYVRGTDTESFPLSGLSTKDTDDKARLGLRSSLRLFSIISFIARGGAQASRNVREETSGGVTTVTTGVIKYRPYAGAGLKARLGRNLSFNADLTTVFNNFPNMNDNEYMTTASFAVSFP